MEKGLEEGLIGIIKETFSLPDTDLKTYSPLTLAFIGDVVYDLIIRTLVVEQGNAPVNKLHKRVSSMVKASAQMELYHRIEDMLTEEEVSVYKRGRNAKSFTTAKNASITEYRSATGFEALIGYLYLDNRLNRALEIIKTGLERESGKTESIKLENIKAESGKTGRINFEDIKAGNGKTGSIELEDIKAESGKTESIKLEDIKSREQ